MTAYQKSLHHTIHGPNEPLPVKFIPKPKVLSIEPLKKEKERLPLLPHSLLEEQKSLTELREIPQTGSCVTSPFHPSPSGIPGHQHQVKPRSPSAGLIRKRSSELLLNSDPESVMTRYFPPLESLTDPLSIVDRLKREPELGFLYLTPVEGRHSVKYNPYNLR